MLFYLFWHIVNCFSLKAQIPCMDKLYLKLLLTFFIFLSISFTSIRVFSQTSDLDAIVNDFLLGESVYDQINHLTDEGGTLDIIDNIDFYLKNDNSRVRGLVYKILRKSIRKEKDLKAKQKGVSELCVNGLSDSDAGNVYVVINYLDEFEENWFDLKSRNYITSIVVQHPPHFSDLIKLVGKIELIQLIPYLELGLQDKKMNYSDIWSINLVLARWGDETKAKYCVKSVKRLGLSDEVVFRLIPDIIYINNKIIFDYLFEEIQKDDLNCLSTDPDNEVEINCAYRLIEFIAPHIIDFPIGLSGTGELNVDNYEVALESVRIWIESNKNSYQLINN